MIESLETVRKVLERALERDKRECEKVFKQGLEFIQRDMKVLDLSQTRSIEGLRRDLAVLEQSLTHHRESLRRELRWEVQQAVSVIRQAQHESTHQLSQVIYERALSLTKNIECVIWSVVMLGIGGFLMMVTRFLHH